MSTDMRQAVRRGALALAHADGVDYFEIGNLAGIADYELVASTVVAAAAAATPGAPLGSLLTRPGAVEAAARALAKAEGSSAFRTPDGDDAEGYRATARTILAGVASVTLPMAA